MVRTLVSFSSAANTSRQRVAAAFTIVMRRRVLCAGLMGVLLVGCTKQPVAEPVTPPSPARTVSALEFTPTALGTPASEFGRPMVTNVQIVDLDRDGLTDVLYCEGRKNTVRWIRQFPRGTFNEQIIGENIPGPAHVEAADLNGSGRLDVLVASMGQILPNNDRIGAVIVLENVDNREFRRHVLLENTARVTDVRAINLHGHTDRRLDLVVAQFGGVQGETRVMKNEGAWEFSSRVVNVLSGSVNVPVADFSGDGAPDFAALISQEWEEVHLFENLRNSQLQDTVVWGSTNEDFGSSGLAVADVNRDGKPDLIYTNGDGFDYAMQTPRPWHGFQWLENRGNGAFKFYRVGDMPGAYSPVAADLNGDGTVDLLAVSCLANWADPKAVSLMAWLNDGRENFTPVVLARRPIQLVTAAVGDLDGDNIPEIVTGGFHALPPFEETSNITLWRRK
jgi:hypothetical protein